VPPRGTRPIQCTRCAAKSRPIRGRRKKFPPTVASRGCAWFDHALCGCYYQGAGWSSPVARWAHNPKVVGSNPTPATNNGYDSKRLPFPTNGSFFIWWQLSGQNRQNSSQRQQQPSLSSLSTSVRGTAFPSGSRPNATSTRSFLLWSSRPGFWRKRLGYLTASIGTWARVAAGSNLL
jgi:hypothetical protein